MLKKGIIYIGLVTIILIIAALPFVIGIIPYFAYHIPMRMGVWPTLLSSLFIFPLWIFISDIFEIILGYFCKNKKLLNVFSTAISAFFLVVLYYLIISPSIILSVLSTSLVFCLFMVMKPWVDKNYS